MISWQQLFDSIYVSSALDNVIYGRLRIRTQSKRGSLKGERGRNTRPASSRTGENLGAWAELLKKNKPAPIILPAMSAICLKVSGWSLVSPALFKVAHPDAPYLPQPLVRSRGHRGSLKIVLCHTGLSPGRCLLHESRKAAASLHFYKKWDYELFSALSHCLGPSASEWSWRIVNKSMMSLSGFMSAWTKPFDS